MSEITCQTCFKTNVVKGGLQKNKKEMLQRYFCKNCKKWFNEKKLNLTQEEIEANELINYLLEYKKEHVNNTRKNIPCIGIKQIIEQVSKKISEKEKTNKDVLNTQIKYFNIHRALSSDVVEVLQESRGEASRLRIKKDYLVDTNDEDFAVLIKNKDNVFIANTFPDQKGDRLTFETQNYRVIIEKQSEQSHNDFSRYYSQSQNERSN